MSISFATLANAYCAYANADMPWTKLHSLAASLATPPERLAHQSFQLAAHAGHSRARRFGYRAAVLPHAMLRLPDLVYGTGCRRAGPPIAITTSAQAVAHLRDCVRSPADTGLFGLGLGQMTMLQLSTGAFLGAAVGRLFSQEPQALTNCAASGALLSCLLWQLVDASMVLLLLTNASNRLWTGVTKFVVVGACFGLGYTVGALFDHLV